MRRLLVLLLCSSAACSPVSGELIEGRGGSARKAANVDVILIGQVDRFFERCELIHSLADSIRLARGAFKDSVFRANERRVRGSTERYAKLMADIDSGRLGDPATAFLERWKAVDSAYPIDVVWHGRTNGDGRFRSGWLPTGRYLLKSGFSQELVSHGLFGSRVQMEYRDFNVIPSCEMPDGRFQGW